MNSIRIASAAVRKALSERRLILTLWVLNLGIALVAVLGPRAAIHGHFDHSLVGRGDWLDAEALTSLSAIFGRTGDAVGIGIFVSIMLAFVTQLVVTGGIIGRLSAFDQMGLGAFFSDSFTYLWRNARIFLWSLLGLIPVGLLSFATGRLLGKAMEGQLHQARFDVPSLLQSAFTLALFVAWRATFDAARVIVFATGDRRTRKALIPAVKLVLGRPMNLVGYALVGVGGLLVLWLLARVYLVLPGTTGGAWLAILVGQLMVWMRLAFSTATTAYVLFAYRVARPVPFAAPVGAPVAKAA